MSARLRTWWNEPAGAREVFALALPLVISTSSITVMQFVDRVFLLWYSPEANAAAVPAGFANWVAMCLPWGIAMYVNTFVSQYFGAKRKERIGSAVWQGIWLSVATIPYMLALIPLTPWMFSLSQHAPDVEKLEVVYFQVMCYGASSVVASAALASFFTGRGDTRTVMVVDTGAALADGVLDYALIFGKWGFPEWGVAGAAWTTVYSQWARVLVFFILFMRASYRREYGTLRGIGLDWNLMVRMIRYGAPSAVQIFVESAAVTAFVFLVGRLGPLQLGASNLALSINMLAFMPMFAVGMAATTLVGQRLGANEPELAARSTWSAFWLATIYSVAISILYVATPDFFLLAHKVNADPAAFPQLREITIVLLRFVAAYCVFDTANIIFVSAIKGAGDTRFVLGVSTLTSLALIVVTWLALTAWGLGVNTAWAIIMVWVVLLGLIYYWRFQQGKWKSMRVIESQPTTPLEDESLDEELAAC